MNPDWSAKNRRRIELIRKHTYGSLSSAEEAELDSLQAELRELLRPIDDKLLQGMSLMERDARDHPVYWLKCIGKEALRITILLILAIACLTLAAWIGGELK